MRRGISNQTALIANLAVQASRRAIEAAGGYELTGKPNRELRRRMERDARRIAKRVNKEGK